MQFIQWNLFYFLQGYEYIEAPFCKLGEICNCYKSLLSHFINQQVTKQVLQARVTEEANQGREFQFETCLRLSHTIQDKQDFSLTLHMTANVQAYSMRNHGEKTLINVPFAIE